MKHETLDVLFPSLLRGQGCPSDFAIARLVNGTASEEEAMLAHAEACPECRARIEESRTAHALSLHEPIPPSLLLQLSGDPSSPLQTAKRKRSLRNTTGMAAVAASFVVLLMFFLRPPESLSTRTKGDTVGWSAVTVDLKRGDVVVRSNVPLASLAHDVKAGDKLRFNVYGAGERGWVRVYTEAKDGSWEKLFSGAAPASGGPLPMAVEITGEEGTRLRFEFCPSEQRDRQCSEKIFDL